MKKHIIGALVVLLLPAVCLAAGEAVVKTGKQSDANITGHVVDAKSGEHLAYATVAVKGTTIGCATDATGHYFLKNLPLGRFTLVASSVGYRSAETTVEIVADRTAEVNFSLNEEALAGRRFGQPYGDQPEVLAHDRLRRLDETVRIDRVEQPG